MRALYLAAVLFGTSFASAVGQTTPSPAGQAPPPPYGVFPGDRVPENMPPGQTLTATDIAVTLTWADTASLPSGCSSSLPAAADGVTSSGFSFIAPRSLCVGQYSVKATQQAPKAPNGAAQPDIQNLPVQKLQVKQTLPVTDKPVITGVSPKALFSEDKTHSSDGKDYYSLVFFGPSSLKTGDQDSVRIKDRVLPNCGVAQASAQVPANDSANGPGNTTAPQNGKMCYLLLTNNPTAGEIGFQLYDGMRGSGAGESQEVLKDLSGPQFLSFVHNGAESDPQRVLFVNASKSTPRDIALGVAAALVLLTYLLLSAGRKGLSAGTSGRTYFLTALFLDEETMTYSLSKCQFYAWTLAAILGYVFLAVSKSVIQGSAVFPEIPAGLPGILVVSVGTGVLASTITNSKGTKGAGQVHPTLADFITSGGVVAPERLQFVVWTVVGIFTFLTIVFKSDPLTVTDLPRIPDGFLQLMGISSAGYLAGKMARKPGPVIKAVSVSNVTMVAPGAPAAAVNAFPQPPNGVTPSGAILTLDVKGENLDPDSMVKVDGQPLGMYLYWVTPGTPDPQTKFCNELTVSLNDAAAYLEGTHTLTIVNTDAQAADVQFPVDPMTIASLTTAATNVTVTGTNFTQGTTASWQGTAPGSIPVPVVGVTVTSPTALTVPLAAGVAPGGQWKLILTSPVGLTASKVY
jgi:hypothetical protein